MAFVVRMHAGPQAFGQELTLKLFGLLDLVELQAGEVTASVRGVQYFGKLSCQRLESILDAIGQSRESVEHVAG